MELSSCPQCSAKLNIPLSFSFFLTNRFHLALSCSHCGARYVPTMLQRIVQLILLLAFSIGCGLLYTPLLRLEFTLSAVGTFRLLPLWVLVVLLVLALAHWLPLRVLPWKLQADNEEFHRGRSVSFFIISFVSLILAIPLVAYLFDREALRAFFP